MDVNSDKLNNSIFSKGRLNTKYVDIAIDCMRYDDESWSYPLNSIYDIARDKGYNNIIFVLGRDTYSRPVSYCGVYEILTERYMIGLDCACIEPLNCSESFDFRDPDTAKKNLDTLRSNIVDYVCDLYSGKVDYSLKNNTFSKLLSGDSMREDYYNISSENPLKRNILILFDKSFGDVDTRIADTILDKMKKNFISRGNEVIYSYIENAYFWYQVALEGANKLGITPEEYVNMSSDTDESETVKSVSSRLAASDFLLINGRGDEIHLKRCGEPISMPPGYNYNTSGTVNERIDSIAEHLIVRRMPSYLDYIYNDISELDGDNKIYSDDIADITQENEMCNDANNKLNELVSRNRDDEYLSSHNKYDINDYDEDTFSKLVKKCGSAIRIAYNGGDAKLLMFPHTIVTPDELEEQNISDNSVTPLDGLEIIDGELETRSDL